MTVGTDFYVYVALMRRTGIEAVAARAQHTDFVIYGMNCCLHWHSTLFDHLILTDKGKIQQFRTLAGKHLQVVEEHLYNISQEMTYEREG